MHNLAQDTYQIKNKIRSLDLIPLSLGFSILVPFLLPGTKVRRKLIERLKLESFLFLLLVTVASKASRVQAPGQETREEERKEDGLEWNKIFLNENKSEKRGSSLERREQSISRIISWVRGRTSLRDKCVSSSMRVTPSKRVTWCVHFFLSFHILLLPLSALFKEKRRKEQLIHSHGENFSPVTLS